MARKQTEKRETLRYGRTAKVKDADAGLSVPDEVWKKISWLTVLGRTELTVEGHEGILSYETECIQIRLTHEILSVGGNRLTIDYYNDEELKIIGCIEQIRWESR